MSKKTDNRKTLTMHTLKLADSECNILEDLAHRSKMDEWFSIGKGNTVQTKDIRTLIEGLTEHDVEILRPNDIIMLLQIQKDALTD